MTYGSLFRPARWVAGCVALAALVLGGWLISASNDAAGAGADHTSIRADLGHNPVMGGTLPTG